MQATTETAPSRAEEKYLVFSASGDFWLGVLFTTEEAAEKQAAMTPGHYVRPLSEVLAENGHKA